MADSLTITRPDDWHLHLRDGAAMAAVLVMEKEGVTQAFGVPGAAINPLYASLRQRQGIAHILARHVEAASHMA